MFEENRSHAQEKLTSPVKELPPRVKKKLEDGWSTPFYEHVFTQIDETKFEVLFHEGYSRPNKPVNELVALEIIKHMHDLSDEELENAYIFDMLTRNALGKEMFGDNICRKTFTNFRRRLMEHEEETGEDLLQKVFEDHRDYLQDEFDIDTSTQRMDSTFIEANIKQLSRIDLIAKVIHNFLDDLPDEIVQDLPEGITKFADTENLDLSYRLGPGEVDSTIQALAESAGWLVDRFEADDTYAQLESFAHLQRVLDEQCYRIAELEEDEPDDTDNDDENDQPGDGESPGWEPVSPITESEDGPEQEQAKEDTDETAESDEPDHVGLKEPDEIGSDSLQNPHDPEATYRRKNDEDHHGYKVNLAETCGDENPFRLITTVGLEPNNTDDGEMLAEDAQELSWVTTLKDLLVDGGYNHEEAEAICDEANVNLHFSGIRGSQPDPDAVSVAEAEWDGTRMVACPAGHEPFEQWYLEESGRRAGRLDKSACENCPHKEQCFVTEREEFYYFGIYDRELTAARRRKRINQLSDDDFLNLRAGAESLINEMYHKIGKMTSFTGQIKVKNESIATAIGTNLKRLSRYLESEKKSAKPTA
jgi:hypothetical protein